MNSSANIIHEVLDFQTGSGMSPLDDPIEELILCLVELHKMEEVKLLDQSQYKKIISIYITQYYTDYILNDPEQAKQRQEEWINEVLSHLSPSGDCPIDEGFVYIAKTMGTNNYKIGSTNDISHRFLGLKTANPHLVIIASRRSSCRFLEEHFFHQLLKEFRIDGEWFALGGQQLADFVSQYGFNYQLEEGVE